MVKLYPIEHPFIKQNYPLVYQVFGGVKDNTGSSKPGNVGAVPTASAKGYDLFKQIGLKLKEKNRLQSQE